MKTENEEISILEFRMNKLMRLSENEYNEIFFEIISCEFINGTCSEEKAEEIINNYIDNLRLKENKGKINER